MVNRNIIIGVASTIVIVGIIIYLVIREKPSPPPSNGKKPPSPPPYERVKFNLKNIPVSCPNGYTNYSQKGKEYAFKNVNGCIPSIRVSIPTNLEWGYYPLITIAHSTDGKNRIGLVISASIHKDGKSDFLWSGIKDKRWTPKFPLEHPVAVGKPDNPPKEMSFSETTDAYYLGWHTLDGRNYYYKIAKNGTEKDNIIIGHSEFYIYHHPLTAHQDASSFSVCSSCPEKETQEGMLSMPNKTTLLHYDYQQCLKKANSQAEARLCLNKYTQQLRELNKKNNLTGNFLPTS